MKLNTIFLLGTDVKKYKGNWHPVVSLDVVIDDIDDEILRRKCGEDGIYIINNSVILEFNKDNNITLGIQEEPKASFFGYRSARVSALLEVEEDESRPEEVWEFWVKMCEDQGFRPDNHSTIVFGGRLAVRYDDGRLAIGNEWEEGLW